MSEEARLQENSEKSDSGLSRRARIVIELVKEFNSNEFIRNHLRENKRGKSDFDKPFKFPEHFDVSRYDMKNFKMEFLRWKGSENGRVVMQLHGGGYVGMLKSYYRSMAKLYSEVGDKISVLTIDYRVAPGNPFPAALEDALCAYRWLLESGYNDKQIIVAGDSAGGGLALALCHYLKDKDENLPGGIILMSPWTDLTLSGESYTSRKDIDPIFGHGGDELLHDNPYVGENSPENPYISPLFGELGGFPPILIQVGTSEILYSDSASLAQKAKAAGVKVHFTEYEGMFHVFQAAGNMMPEAKCAWDEVGRFIKLTKEL